MVGKNTYLQKLGLRKTDLAWTEMAEGRVFLSGHFKVVGPRSAPKCLQPGGNRDLLRIDGRLSTAKKEIKKLYSSLSCREVDHG
jgi:hypothetical protein